MLSDLKTKIYDYLAIQDNAFKTAIVGGLHYVENISETPTYPYAVYQFISGNSDRDTGSRFENPIVQITIYDNASSSIGNSANGELFDARFDECEASILMTDYYVLGVDRISPPRENRTYQGDWEWSADYRIQLQTK